MAWCMDRNMQQYLDVMLKSLVNMFTGLSQRPIQTMYNFPSFIVAFNVRNFKPPEIVHQFSVSVNEIFMFIHARNCCSQLFVCFTQH